MATSTCTKEFIVHCGDGKAGVNVTSEHTLGDVRRLMYEDWDEDILPDRDVEWAFCVVDSDCRDWQINEKQERRKQAWYQRISEKQERRKKAWYFIGQDIRILEGIDKNCNKNCNKNKKRPGVIPL